jgi:hypothetical protein
MRLAAHPFSMARDDEALNALHDNERAVEKLGKEMDRALVHVIERLAKNRAFLGRVLVAYRRSRGERSIWH